MTDRAKNATVRVSPPSKHELAAMIWLCVFPTLTAINLTFSGWLRPMSPVLRTFVLATVAVPIVIYGLMPVLGRVRVRLFSAIACARDRQGVRSTNADPCGASQRGQDEKHPRPRLGGASADTGPSHSREDARCDPVRGPESRSRGVTVTAPSTSSAYVGPGTPVR